MSGRVPPPKPGYSRLLPRTLLPGAVDHRHAGVADAGGDRVWPIAPLGHRTRRLVWSVAGDIGLVLRQIDAADVAGSVARLQDDAAALLDFGITYQPGVALSDDREPRDYVEETMRDAMARKVNRRYTIGNVEGPPGPGSNAIGQMVCWTCWSIASVCMTQPYIFILWMVGSALVLFAVAIVFVRNNSADPPLADAARSFGIGGGDLPIEGASEVRQAAVAFGQMRDRIRRQLTERTEMLAGVSTCTPLTRSETAFGDDGTGNGLMSCKATSPIWSTWSRAISRSPEARRTVVRPANLTTPAVKSSRPRRAPHHRPALAGRTGIYPAGPRQRPEARHDQSVDQRLPSWRPGAIQCERRQRDR